MPLLVPDYDGYGVGDIIQTAYATLLTDATTTSTSYVDLVTLSVTTIGGSSLEIYATYSVSNEVNNATSGADSLCVTIDGTQLLKARNEQWRVSESGAIYAMTDELAAGSHTVALRWKTQSGKTFRCSAQTLTRPEHASVVVIEIMR